MNSMLKKMSIIFIAVLLAAGCSKPKQDNSDNIDALKAHMVKNDQSVKINSMVEAFAGLVADEAQQKEMIDKAKEAYATMNIKEIYLVTGSTAESNEAIIGSLIHFKTAMTIEEAKKQLGKDDQFKNQDMDLVMNGNFAFATSTMNGKKVTPKSIVTAFKAFN